MVLLNNYLAGKGCHNIKEIPFCHEIKSFMNVLTNACNLKGINIFTPNFHYFNTILPSTPIYPLVQSLQLTISTQHFLRIFHLPCGYVLSVSATSFFLILRLVGKEYKLCSFLQSFFSQFLASPNILFSTLLTNIMVMRVTSVPYIWETG